MIIYHTEGLEPSHRQPALHTDWISLTNNGLYLSTLLVRNIFSLSTNCRSHRRIKLAGSEAA